MGRAGGGMRHAGSTTLLLDLNGDDLKDALVSDVSSNNIYALYNCGTSTYTYMDSVDRRFPSYDTPINQYIFPATYYVCLLYTSPSPRDRTRSRMPSSA